MFDKQKHKDDFKLRLLVTNDCNKSCQHCLNDFQVKGSKYLEFSAASQIINEYCLFMKKRGLEPRVELSGGEPGLHPYLEAIIMFAKASDAFVKVNTNGLALNTIPQKVRDIVDCWHIGVTGCDNEILYDIKEVGGQAQYVVKHDELSKLKDTVHFYRSVPLKLFIDFYAKGKKKRDIEQAIKDAAYIHPNLKTRYTGIQENRGKVCKGCNRKCITLKALWVFPDGTMSLCPQHQRKTHMINTCFMPSMEMMYNQHNVGG